MNTTRSRPLIVLSLLALLAASLTLPGCALYVNIPAADGDVAIHNPNHRTVVAVMTSTLKKAIAQQPSASIGLPAGTTTSTGQQIADAVGAQSDKVSQVRFEVRGVRIRGEKAEVDLVRVTAATGRSDLTTVTLETSPFGGWVVQRMRPWRGGDVRLLPDQTY